MTAYSYLEVNMEKNLKPHEILANENNYACICPETDCEWHGNCTDCMVLHRYHATIPNCLEIQINKQKNIDIDFINKPRTI